MRGALGVQGREVGLGLVRVRALLLLPLLALACLLSACSWTSTASPSPSPSASSAGAYRSDALGIAFRHPVGWRLKRERAGTAAAPFGEAAFRASNRTGLQVFVADAAVPEARSVHKPAAWRAETRAVERRAGFRMVAASRPTVAGERATRLDFASPDVRMVCVGVVSQGRAVELWFSCRKDAWGSERASLRAVLSSLECFPPSPAAVNDQQ